MLHEIKGGARVSLVVLTFIGVPTVFVINSPHTSGFKLFITSASVIGVKVGLHAVLALGAFNTEGHVTALTLRTNEGS